MKSLYIIIFTMVTNFHVSAKEAEKIKWYTIDEALKINATSPRKILIDVFTDWCGYCKVMDAETFSHPIIAKYINQNFYAVKFDAESLTPVQFAGYTFTNQGSGISRKTTHQFATALGVNGYPTVVYFTGDLKLIGAVPSFLTAEQIEPLLHYIVDEKYMSISLEEYQKTFVSELKKK